jgi:lysophospholipase L1-like esterase
MWTYGTKNGLPNESNIDFSFITDSTTMTLVYYHYNGYTGSNYHDHQMFIEHNGRMMKLSSLPATSTAGGGVYYRKLTFKEGREREYRVLLPMNCWLMGVYIDNLATIRKAPNKFFVLVNGDSWNEPAGSILASPIGGAWPTGTYRVAYTPQAIIEATGWAVGLVAQGGTGHFNVNDGVAHPDSYASAASESTFLGTTRVNDMATKFFGRNPVLWTIGGWNDGSLGGTGASAQSAYNTRVLAGIDYTVSKKSDIKMMFSTIQPVASTGTQYDADRAASVAGQIAAYQARTANVIGYIDESQMWLDMSTSGQRGNNVNNTDGIHLHTKGANMVSNWHLAQIATFQISANYVNTMLAYGGGAYG